MPSDGVENGRLVEGFGKTFVRARAPGVLGGSGPVRKNDDRRAGEVRVRLDHAANVESGHAGQSRVEEDKVRAFPPDDPERLAAAVGQKQLAVSPQLDLLSNFPEESGIVNQENGRHRVLDDYTSSGRGGSAEEDLKSQVSGNRSAA